MEERAAELLGAIAVGVVEGIGGTHGQALGAQGRAVGQALGGGMPARVERDGGDAAAVGAGLIDVPGVERGIGGDVGGLAPRAAATRA